MKNTARKASDFRQSVPVSDTRAATILPSANDGPSEVSFEPLRQPSRPASTPPDGAFRNAGFPAPGVGSLPRVMGMPRKARRTAEQVIESLPTKYDEASYVLGRIAALDLRKQKLLRAASEETLPLIFEQRPDLVSLFNKG